MAKGAKEKDFNKKGKEGGGKAPKENPTIPSKARIRLVAVLVSLVKVLDQTLLSHVSTVVKQVTKQTVVGSLSRFETWGKELTIPRLVEHVQISKVLVQ